MKFYKTLKNRHFPKGLVHGFFVKVDLFLIRFFFEQKRKKQTFIDILDRKECFLDLKSQVLKYSKKSTFSKGVSPWFLAKIRPSSYMFFLSKQSKKQTYFDILDSKESFFDLKGEVLKNSKKIDILQRG